MKKLIKSDVQYRLHNEEGVVIATSFENGKLSKENCDELFGIVNINTMMEDIESNCEKTKEGFVLGILMAMESNKNKVFTLEELYLVFALGKSNDETRLNKLVDSKQPIEIDVEIEKVVDETKVIGAVKGVKGSGHKITTYKSVPKLDSEGCLILKKI